MAGSNRASMREGPLAQLFRKTDGEGEEHQEKPKQKAQSKKAQSKLKAQPKEKAQQPSGGTPLPADGRGPQTTRQMPEPQGKAELHEPASEAARREQRRSERGRRRAEAAMPEPEPPRVPSPEERLRNVFSSDIPENIMDRPPERHQ